MTYKVYLVFNMLVQRQTYCFWFYCQYLWINIEKDANYKLIFLSKEWILMFVLGILLYVHMHIHIYVKFLFIHVCVMIIWLIVSFIIMNSTSSIFENVNNIHVLNSTNFKKWKEHVVIVLGCMDLDYALREDRPSDLTDASIAEQRSTMEKWERSNRMSLMIMKHSIPEAIRGAIPEETRAKTFLDQIANWFAVNEKVETNTILSKLVSMRYKRKYNIKEYIMKMFNLVARLKTLKLELLENILVHLVLISLSTQFSPFKINYNTQKEKWTLNELIA